MDPNDYRGYFYRGVARDNMGEYEKAIADYTNVIRLGGKDERSFEISTYGNLAWLWATGPISSFRHGRKAVEYAMKAYELSDWEDDDCMDLLAAAYAEIGDFKNAVKWETKYLEISNLSASDIADAKGRLALYQTHKPYHESK